MPVSQFLNAVLPSRGIRFALAQLGAQGDPDFRPGQRSFPEGDTAGIIGYLATKNAEGRNCFFAVGGYDFVTNPDDPDQRPRRYAHAARHHRSLRLDIDPGDGKHYADKRAAAAALLDFIRAASLPAPWIVDSGSGFHVYWGFDRDVDLAQWKVMAARLSAACRQHGLVVDSTSTEDAARILRLPGTHNNKPKWAAAGMAPPVVRILQQGVAADPELLVANFPAAGDVEVRGMAFAEVGTPTLLPEMRMMVRAKDFGSPYTSYSLRGVLSQCPGMSAMLATGGANAAEPLWMLALTLINKAEDTDEVKYKVARAVSSGHAGFDEAELGRKWQQVQQQGYHPPQCARLEAFGMHECKRCPLRGSITSPISLGYPQQVMLPEGYNPLAGPTAISPTPTGTGATAAVPPPSAAVAPALAALAPSPTLMPAAVAAPSAPQSHQAGVFVFTPGQSSVQIVDGTLTHSLKVQAGYPVILRKPKEEGGQLVPERLLSYRIVAVERMMTRGEDTRAYTRLTIHAEQDGTQDVMFTDDELAEKGKFNARLRRHSIYVKPRLLADFHEHFMIEFLQQLQRLRAANSIATRCGWAEDFSSFTLGHTIYRRDGTEDSVQGVHGDSELAGFTCAGDELRWREAFDTTMAGGPDRQVMLALSIAGPLMPFTGVDGVMVNAYSPESGVGKSTLCDAALSVWGSPNALRKDFRDTANATFRLATISGNMPLVVDEFTNVEGKHLSDYVYTLTQGREKKRLGADAKLQSTGDRWCLLAMATSNNSVHEKLQRYREAATAEAARVFEIRLHPLRVDPNTMGDMKVRLRALDSSYGFLGPQLARLFMSKPPEYWDKVVSDRISKWDRIAAAGTGDRFRSVVCALAEIGASLGRALGYAFDLDGVEAQLKAHWEKQVTEFEKERKTPLDFLNEYMTLNSGQFITMAGPNCDQPGVPPGLRVPAGEIRNKPGETRFTAHTLVLPVSQLREHVRKTGDWKQFYEWLSRSQLVWREATERVFTATVTPVTTPCLFLDYVAVTGMGKAAKPAVAASEETRNTGVA